jgi:hypothetical protein
MRVGCCVVEDDRWAKSFSPRLSVHIAGALDDVVALFSLSSDLLSRDNRRSRVLLGDLIVRERADP